MFCYSTLILNSGQTLQIEALGLVKERIEEGAYVVLQVKYGLIRLINTKADLCEQVKNVDMECPIEKGKTKITKDIDLPTEIPPVSRLDVILRGECTDLHLRGSILFSLMSTLLKTSISHV
jgi:hypothetical protein